MTFNRGREIKTVKIGAVEVGDGVPKVIVPIIERTADAIIEKAKSFFEIPLDVVEWRVDFFDSALDIPAVISTLKALRKALVVTPILFTFRTKREGGQKDISLPAYEALNISVANSGYADAIDIEIFGGDGVVRRCIEAIHAAGKIVIGSNHAFDGTPDKSDILYRLRKAQDLGADIPKIAVMPHSFADVITLLDATQDMHDKFADRPIMTMSMAEGVISRLAGECFGSAMTFGAVGKPSAPGQIPVEKLLETLAVLHKAIRPTETEQDER